jgi:predicted enzyme related to lactoylglutathione lyase
MKKALIILFVVLSNSAWNQEILSSLQGDWQQKNSNKIEHWDLVQPNKLTGFCYEQIGTSIQVTEYIEIELKGKKTLYSATVLGQNNGSTVKFKSIPCDTAWVFENKKHDFPTRIIYQYMSDNFLQIHLIGKGKTIDLQLDRKGIDLSVPDTLARVTGLGGIFFFSSDVDSLKQWYENNLGFYIDEYGATFETRNVNNPLQVNYTQWSPFKKGTTYFSPSTKDFMINYRVQHLDELVNKLRENGVVICDEIETYDYGKFVHILDLEGNKIELWEPIDDVLKEYGEQNNTNTIK